MAKILIGLIPTKGKTKEQILKEIQKKNLIEKANQILKLSKKKKVKKV